MIGPEDEDYAKAEHLRSRGSFSLYTVYTLVANVRYEVSFGNLNKTWQLLFSIKYYYGRVSKNYLVKKICL